MRARARDQRPCLSLDVTLPVVCGRPPAAAEAAGAAPLAVRPPRGLRHLQLAGAPCALDAEGTGARELLHPVREEGAAQARRPAREGDRDAAPRADRTGGVPTPARSAAPVRYGQAPARRGRARRT